MCGGHTAVEWGLTIGITRLDALARTAGRMAGLGHAGDQSRVCQGRGRRSFPRGMAGKELGSERSADTVSAGNAGRRALQKPGRRAWHPCQDDRSAERLSIQVHPDKEFSRKYFHSDYGKTECWYILQTREVQGQEPYLLMGFRPGVTRERWQHCYETQDIRGMIDCMHKVTPKAGEVC